MTDFNQKLIADLRAHGGRASSGPFQGSQVLILTTRGARTGHLSEQPLAYHLDGDRIVIIASKGGAPTNPGWYYNLVADPIVTVELDGERFEAHAEVVDDGAEYERLYTDHARLMPGFLEYRQRTNRRIPVIALERLEHEEEATA